MITTTQLRARMDAALDQNETAVDALEDVLEVLNDAITELDRLEDHVKEVVKRDRGEINAVYEGMGRAIAERDRLQKLVDDVANVSGRTV